MDFLPESGDDAAPDPFTDLQGEGIVPLDWCNSGGEAVLISGRGGRVQSVAICRQWRMAGPLAILRKKRDRIRNTIAKYEARLKEAQADLAVESHEVVRDRQQRR